MEALKREADAWLSQLIEDLSTDPFYRDGWDLLDKEVGYGTQGY